MNSKKIYIIVGLSLVAVGVTYVFFSKKIDAYISDKFHSKK